MTAYYNEIDPFAAAWLRKLIEAGHIAKGEVDERSIEDVKPDELREFTQCHWFAGLGAWSYALRQAGWPDNESVWSGSCPCQPFSAAGKRGGTSDERHLWPSWFHLIEQCRPNIIFGEQVEAAIKQNWLDLVQDDLEGIGYSVAPHGLAACHLGAPHIRKRLYFVADSSVADEYGWSSGWQQSVRQSSSSDVRLAHSEHSERRPEFQKNSDAHRGNGFRGSRDSSSLVNSESKQVGVSGCSRESRSSRVGLAHSEFNQRRQECSDASRRGERSDSQGLEQRSLHGGLVNGFWRDADWVYCRDEKYRPAKSEFFPLAHGITNRVGKLRGYGNAIVAPVAQAFIEAFIDTRLAGAQTIGQSGRGLNREDSALGGKPLPPG